MGVIAIAILGRARGRARLVLLLRRGLGLGRRAVAVVRRVEDRTQVHGCRRRPLDRDGAVAASLGPRLGSVVPRCRQWQRTARVASVPCPRRRCGCGGRAMGFDQMDGGLAAGALVVEVGDSPSRSRMDMVTPARSQTSRGPRRTRGRSAAAGCGLRGELGGARDGERTGVRLDGHAAHRGTLAGDSAGELPGAGWGRSRTRDGRGWVRLR